MAAKVKIGVILKDLRQKKGVTLSQAAEGAGMTAPALSYYEKDEKDPSLEYAIKLADYYGVTLDELCGRSSTSSSLDGLMRAFLILRRSEMVQELNFKEVYWRESKEVDQFEDDCYCIAEEENPGLSIKLKKALWCIHNDRLTRFMEAYEQLSKLVESKQLDSSVLDIWLEKQFMDASKAKKVTNFRSKVTRGDKPMSPL